MLGMRDKLDGLNSFHLLVYVLGFAQSHIFSKSTRALICAFRILVELCVGMLNTMEREVGKIRFIFTVVPMIETNHIGQLFMLFDKIIRTAKSSTLSTYA